MLQPYSVRSEAVSLPEEQEAEDGRDGRLGQGEDKEGRLHSSAQPLLERHTALHRLESPAQTVLMPEHLHHTTGH